MPRGTKSVGPDTSDEGGAVGALNAVRLQFQLWQVAKDAARRLAVEAAEGRDALMGAVEAMGEPDDKGHVWLSLGTPIEGFDAKGKPKKYNALQRQRKVRAVMDEDVAIQVLEKHGILDECSKSFLQIRDTDAAIQALAAAGLLEGHGIEVVTEVQEDAVRVAYFEGKITEAEYNDIITTQVSWALLPSDL